MYMSIFWYLRVLPVVHRPDVVDIGDNQRLSRGVLVIARSINPRALALGLIMVEG